MFTAPSTLTHYNSTYDFISPIAHAGVLQGRTALITGAGRGLGREMAQRFANAGARVICVGRKYEDIAQVARELNADGRDSAIALAISADVADPKAAASVLDQVRQSWGSDTVVDILVANAGMTRFNPLACEDPGLDAWWRVLEVNVRGTVSFVRAVMPGMIAKGEGTIISLASTSGSQDIPFNSAYAASKAAVIKFNQDLGAEIEGTGVHCFAVHPGSVATDLGSTEGAFNVEALQDYPKMAEIAGKFEATEMQTADLAANTCVALCVEEDAKLMSGMYIDAEHDLEAVLEEAKRGDDGRIKKERLYWLGVREL